MGDKKMNSNLLYIRQRSNSTKKLIAKLLNVSVYTYIGYETGRLLIPNEILIMFAKVYNIPTSDLFCREEDISNATTNKLSFLSNISEAEREKQLIKNLTGSSHSNISYHGINQLKNKIISSISYKEMP